MQTDVFVHIKLSSSLSSIGLREKEELSVNIVVETCDDTVHEIGKNVCPSLQVCVLMQDETCTHFSYEGKVLVQNSRRIMMVRNNF